MEPMEINGGRFYLRPLHDDNRIDDRPALEAVFNRPVPEDYVEKARQGWASKSTLSWAVCEQTNVELLALVTLSIDGDRATLHTQPAGEPTRMLPNDPALTPKTVGDAATEGHATARRWAQGYLNLEVVDGG